MSARLRLFPLNAVLFPGAVLNLHVFEPRYKQMIGECLESGESFGVVLIREGKEAGDPSVVPHQVGSIAEIVEVTPLPFGRMYISTIGRDRFRIRKIVDREPYLTVDAEILHERDDDREDLVNLEQRARGAFVEYLDLLGQFTGEQAGSDLPTDARGVSYAIADALQVADPIKQRLLELNSARQRLITELRFLRRIVPQMQKLLERRAAEQAAREARGEDDSHRSEQERYFGKYFSPN